MLQDKQCRTVRYLRLSVTDRCNLRCQYCMPEHVEFLPRRDLLSFEESEAIVGHFVSLGVNHVRITGGEPLARRGIVDLVRRVASVPGVEDLAMTTNAVLLERYARGLADAGLRRLNVSLDSVDPAVFHRVTRRGDLAQVLRGLDAAQDAGFALIKINAVLVRGVNDDHAGELLRFCRDRGFVLRFIEYMPIGADAFWSDKTFLSIDDVRRTLEAQGFRLEPLGGGEKAPAGGGPARYWSAIHPDGGPPQRVGFIAAVSHNFCMACNRVRLTSDGRIRECLTHGSHLSLRDMLRAGASDEVMRDAIRNALYGKVDGHGFRPEDGGKRTVLPMSALGG